MEQKSLPRVLVIDDDPRIGEDLTELLEDEYEIAVAAGSGQALMDDTRAIAPSFRPHVAVVDLRLIEGKGSDLSGLELIDFLNSACCILYSAYLTPGLTNEALNKYGVTRWASKRDPSALLEAVNQAAGEYSATVRGLFVQNSGPSSSDILSTLFNKNEDLPLEMVDDVLVRLFPRASRLVIEPIDGAVVTPATSRISWGRSVVLKISPDDLQPVVVKFGPAERILEEKRNYDDYVDARLGGLFYAQLKDVVTFWDLGCAAYTFLGTQLRSMSSFRVFYQDPKRRTPKKIIEPLSQFFGDVWSGHYMNDKPSKEYSQLTDKEETPIEYPNLYQLYDRALKLESRLERLGNVQRQRSFPGLSAYFRNPAQWVGNHIEDSLLPSARIAITHGDLHGDNLFVENSNAWAIDFERTGWSHNLRDFVELETDIISRLLVDDNELDMSCYYAFFTVLAEPDNPAPATMPPNVSRNGVVKVFPSANSVPPDSSFFKALSVIAGLRQLASVMTRYEDAREYVWALLLTSLFVATLYTEKDNEQVFKRDKIMLLASILCERLRNWGRQWPPKEWPEAKF